MTINAQFILLAVGAVLLLLAVLDIGRHRRITPAAKARLLTAVILMAVGIWLASRA